MGKRARHSSLSVIDSQDSQGQHSHQEKREHEATNKILHTAAEQKTIRIHCSLPPHQPLGFTSYEEYEIHYTKSHVNRCLECHRNLPTEHFLSLHIAENHDPITASKRDRGDKIYACLVEGCDKVCSTWQKRRMHLVDKHLYPRNYDFFVVNDGLDGRRSMLRPERKLSNQQKQPLNTTAAGPTSDDADAMAVEDTSSTSDSASVVMTPASSDDTMDALTSGMSSLKFVPNSVRFGRKKGLSGFSKT